MCVESMEEPQQAAPGMVFSARARSGIPHTESGVNKDSQEPRVGEEGTRRNPDPGSRTLYPVQKVLLVNKTWLYDKLSLDDHAEDKQLHAFLVLDNTHSFPKICCQFSLIVSAGSKKIYFFLHDE